MTKLGVFEFLLPNGDRVVTDPHPQGAGTLFSVMPCECGHREHLQTFVHDVPGPDTCYAAGSCRTRLGSGRMCGCRKYRERVTS